MQRVTRKLQRARRRRPKVSLAGIRRRQRIGPRLRFVADSKLHCSALYYRSLDANEVLEGRLWLNSLQCHEREISRNESAIAKQFLDFDKS